MKGQSFNLMRKALYQSSEEMTAHIILQKERRIAQLEAQLYDARQRIVFLERENESLKKGQSDPKEEARRQGLEQKFMEAAKVKVWSDLEKKQKLWVDEKGLIELPTKLCLLTQLKELYLGRNSLKFLPKNIGALKELRQLRLYSNQLKKLPQSLGNLRELTWLDLSYNQLTELPQILGNLSKLQQLYIFNNPNLKELPKSFKNLKELNALYVDWQLLPRQNIFKTEPFASLKNLQKLYIDNDDGNEQRIEATKKEGSQIKVRVYYRLNLFHWQ